ncbi:hypothetical protein NAT51_05840 [Flavobacterium amniphilum]|uniref:hypothetical protein n=1 Tax=Flavobacterium amniphilum TaxID=1834035 RepID=UPI00202A2D74|nr:hypothetical protein [Flavobacterium amniphilum]MCL9805029.1 hypothetical protein [Flavobacterium amniphilum]
MKKQTKTKWDFIKRSVVELNDNALKKIKGGDNDNNGTGDANETTKVGTQDGNAISTSVC